MRTFRIYKERSFKTQCWLEVQADFRGTMERYKIIQADCKMEALVRGDNGNINSKDFVEIPEEEFDKMTEKEGDELYLATLNFRYPKVKKKLKTKLSTQNSSSKSKTS